MVESEDCGGGEGPLSFAQIFAEVDDPRQVHLIKYPLVNLLSIALLASICGFEQFEEMEGFATIEQEWLVQLGLLAPGAVPSHDTFRRLFRHLDPTALHDALTRWLQAVAAYRPGNEQIAIDGKALRGAIEKATAATPAMLVNAYACHSRLVLGMQRVPPGGNELTVLPEVLRLLDVNGALVSIDAIGCQKRIAGQVLEQGGAYLLALKENQPLVYAEMAAFADDAIENGQAYAKRGQPIVASEHRSVEKGHGRVETRDVWASEQLEWFVDRREWPGLRSLVRVRSRREVVATGEVGEQVRYYLTSLPADAQRLGEAVRGHWAVENELHWSLDVLYREDDRRARRGHEAFNQALLRRMAVSLLKQLPSEKRCTTLTRKRQRATLDPTYRLQALFGGEPFPAAA